METSVLRQKAAEIPPVSILKFLYMGALEELRGHVEFEQCRTASAWASSAQARLPSGATEHLVFLRSRPWRPRPTGDPSHWRPRPLEVPPGCRGNPLQPSSGLCGAAGERRCHSNGGACLAWSRERGAHPHGRRCRCPCGERAPRGIQSIASQRSSAKP